LKRGTAEPNGRKAKSRPQGVNERASSRIDLSRRGVAAGSENVVNRCREVIQPRARDDDCVPPAVSFLGYPQEFSALVLAEFEMKPLPFDLNFLRFENAVHLKIHLSLTSSFAELEANFTLSHARNVFGTSGF
jgi:hypothetical protein